MVYQQAHLDSVFGALADPTRRRLLGRLRVRDHSISELAAPFAMSLPAVSKHLRVLEKAGLVARRRDGRSWNCRLKAAPMRSAAAWFEDYRLFWDSQLDKLELHLADTTTEERSPWPSPTPPPPPSGSPASSRPRRRGSSRRGPRRRG